MSVQGGQPQKVAENINQKPERIKVLVIDDEQGIRDLLTYELKMKGYEVVTAADGLEGIEKFKKEKFNVIISDIKMPKFSGMEVLEMAKSIDSQAEVIMTTGFGTIDIAVESMKKGAYDFITKPYNLNELFSRLEKALEKQSLSSEITSLKELNRLKSEFLANTSHELRTPMNAIIGYISLMADKVYGPLSEKQEWALKRMSTNANNLLQLINNILDVSKLASGKLQLFFEDFAVNEVVNDVMEMMDSLAKEKNLYIRFEQNGRIEIRSDKTRLKQILINLIGNAIKFTGEGGVTIRAAKEKEDGQDLLKIEIQDTGVGIKQEHVGLIFEEFRQADASTTRQYGGTGLGLSIVKKVVELLNGRIEVASTPGRGSVFTFSIPLKSPDREPIEKEGDLAQAISSLSAKNARIVVLIDDDPEVHSLIRDSLSDTEYTFMGALNGDEGIALIKQYHPFAVLLDLLMPKKDGWSVLQALKSDPETMDVPVIISSIIENKSLGYSLGISDYLIKPFGRKALFEKLERLKISRNKKILVVENEKDLNAMMQMLLKKEGYQHVTSAYDGQEAMDMMNKDLPDIILLDLMMPELNGFEVLDRMQQDPRMSGVKVIIITAKQLTEQENTTLSARAELVLEKGLKDIKTVLSLMRERLKN